MKTKKLCCSFFSQKKIMIFGHILGMGNRIVRTREKEETCVVSK